MGRAEALTTDSAVSGGLPKHPSTWRLKRNDEDRVSRMRRRFTSAHPGFSSTRERFDRRSYPPLLLRTKAKDTRMQVRRIRRGVAGRANIAQNVAFMNRLSVTDSWCVAIQVGVVVAVGLRRIELVDGVAAKTAVEQLDDCAVADCQDRRTARRHDVDRLMRTTMGTALVESVMWHISALKVRKRQTQVSGREHCEIVRNLGTNPSRKDEAH